MSLLWVGDAHLQVSNVTAPGGQMRGGVAMRLFGEGAMFFWGVQSFLSGAAMFFGRGNVF